MKSIWSLLVNIMNPYSNNSVFKKFPILESDRLLLRHFTVKDKKDLFNIRSDDEAMRFMDTNKMKSIKDAEDFIITIINSYRQKSGINWAIVEKQSSSFIGYCGFWRIFWEDRSAEIGYALNPLFWNKGLMAEALVLIIKFGFDILNFTTIIANLNPDNVRSIKLLEKVGFKKEAFLKENYLFNEKYVDTLVYGLIKEEFHSR